MVVIVGNECSKDIKYLTKYSNTEYPAKLNKNIELIFRKKNKNNKYIFTDIEDNKISIKKVLENHEIIFRYGCRSVKLEGMNKVVYNTSKAIKSTINKYNSRLLFKSNNIPTPNTYNCIEIHKEDVINNLKFPLIRRPLKHSKSKDFEVINNINELNYFQKEDIETNNFYYSEFVDKVKEIRLHIAHGKVITIIEKRPPKLKQYSWGMVDNFDNLKWRYWRSDIIESSVKAMKLLGLTFGAIDVIIDKQGNYYLLEVNTAPDFSYSNYLTSKVINYFNWVSEEKKRKDWFNIEPNTPSDFAWKKTDFS